MNHIEYGNENKEVIILLHGGGLSWWNYREVAELLCKDYHVILPILDGHAGSDRDFTTIEANAADIIAYIDEHFGGSVLMIGGLSLGGQILLEILSQRKDICEYAVVESALAIPSKFTYAMLKPAFGSCYGLLFRKWFAKLQFESLRIKPELFGDYFRDTCKITKENMIAFLQENSMYQLKQSIKDSNAKIHVFVGQKENAKMRKSAGIICETVQGAPMRVLPGWYHGEFSINHADEYVNCIYDIMKKQ